ncbi:double-stranded RNA-specific editase 1-like [Paramacrobiotus metropolitanus]|uniref:double-stranded RNA-specific editase 1-like n=1 Tax=Paramacrobiotus metropolitanus TaxID=2943436 RepID=UPI002445F19D|nr:double-stranded RNA-specific editase 1-like [Paramacrobiotus metropolitanus]
MDTMDLVPPAKRKLPISLRARKILARQGLLDLSLQTPSSTGWEPDIPTPAPLEPPDDVSSSSDSPPVAVLPTPLETLKNYVQSVEMKRFAPVVQRLKDQAYAENPVGFVQEFFALGAQQGTLVVWVDGGEVQTGPVLASQDGTPRWEQTVELCGRGFTAQANNKRAAKNGAALAAVQWIYDCLDDVLCIKLPGKSKFPPQIPARPIAVAKPAVPRVLPGDADNTFANRVAELVHSKYAEVMERYGVAEAYRRYAVLAGIVMEMDGKMECICVTTGTKCIDAQQQSLTGQTVKDMHAEILAIRCLKRFLCAHIAAHASNPATSLFHPDTTPLTPRATFTLYISSAPCGDARVFSLSDHADGTDAHPQRQCRGQLRIKIEAGMGGVTVPPGHSGRQYWDAVLGGERMLVMSCSDKLLRRNVVGVQGGLGALMLRPVYWKAVVMGHLWNGDHVGRAMFGRLKPAAETLRELQECGFAFQAPALLHSTYGEKRQITVKHNIAVVWLTNPAGADHFELLNCVKGKTVEQKPSVLCKKSLLDAYLDVWDRAETILPHLVELRDNCPSQRPTYAVIKNLSAEYVRGKALFEEMVRASGIRCWVHKCEEEEGFDAL